MSDQPRPVWLTRERIVQIERAARTPWYGMPQVEKDALLSAVAAWDAAPADATEAVTVAIYSTPPVPSSQARAVLRALGMPDA